MDELMGRAWRAYFMTAARDGYSADMPSEIRSGEQWVDDKRYVALRNGSTTLAVYRVKNNGMLRRMKRWPRCVER